MLVEKRILIIAGPNGAGKTTFAQEFLPNEWGCLTFINADLIAQGLSPFDPERAALQAGRIMLAEIERRVEAGESFALETTLSGKNYARLIPKWRALGYQVIIIYLRLPDVDMAVRRVAERVAKGGHDIPEGTIRMRFERGWDNLQRIYKSLVDYWAIYDNSGGKLEYVAGGRGQ
ncbi:MAG: AAA family ATPase [Candidatus Omnitrophica bacterium]|nr:hypothetical protein [bacterium]NUN95687.1 AAA family ATPase [Candidatus Omnitrophota bacterium]